MEFSLKEQKAVEATIAKADQELAPLTELQLLTVGGGIADVTLS